MDKMVYLVKRDYLGPQDQEEEREGLAHLDLWVKREIKVEMGLMVYPADLVLLVILDQLGKMDHLVYEALRVFLG